MAWVGCDKLRYSRPVVCGPLSRRRPVSIPDAGTLVICFLLLVIDVRTSFGTSEGNRASRTPRINSRRTPRCSEQGRGQRAPYCRGSPSRDSLLLARTESKAPSGSPVGHGWALGTPRHRPRRKNLGLVRSMPRGAFAETSPH